MDQPNKQESETSVEQTAESQMIIDTGVSEQEHLTKDVFANLDDVKTLHAILKHNLSTNEEHLQPIKDLINQVNIMSAQVLTHPSDPMPLFLYEDFIGDYVKAAVKVKTNNLTYAQVIADSFKALKDLFVVELAEKTKTRGALINALKPMFEIHGIYFKNHFQQEEYKVNEVRQDAGEMADEEKSWRNELKEGSMVDVVKFSLAYNLETWSKGEIKQVLGKTNKDQPNLGDETHGPVHFKIQHLNDNSVVDKTVKADSKDIAIFNTKTAGDEWRFNLQKGDQIDFYDANNKTWLNSTIIEGPKGTPTGTTMVKVGQRIYQPEGDKSDSMGNYFGYSELLDISINPFSIRVQKLFSMTQEKGENPPAWFSSNSQNNQSNTNSYHQYNPKTDEVDMSMIKEEGQIIYAVVRNFFCKSAILVNLINELGQSGSFESLLQYIEEKETTFEQVKAVLELLAAFNRLYHKSFIDQFCSRLRQVVQDKILNAEEAQLRSVKLQQVNEIVNKLTDNILCRQIQSSNLQTLRNDINLRIGVCFLKQTFLVKRIDGAQLIDTVCKYLLNYYNLLHQSKKDEQGKEIVTDLQQLRLLLLQADLVNLIFSSENIHSQLVQRSESLLKFLFREKFLTNEHLEMIWQNCYKDDSTAHDLVTCLTVIVESINSEDKQFFIQKLVDRINHAPQTLRSNELDFLLKLGTQNSSKEDEDPLIEISRAQVLEGLWTYLFGPNSREYLNNDLSTKALTAISDLFKRTDLMQLDQYILKIVSELENANEPKYFYLNLVSNFLSSYSFGHQQKRQEFIDELEKKYNILDLFIHELKVYMDVMRKHYKEKKEAGETIKSDKLILSDYQPHNTQVVKRINIIKDYTSYGSRMLTEENLLTLWTEVISKNPITDDHTLLFQWLRSICDNFMLGRSHQSLKFETLTNFFRTITTEQNYAQQAEDGAQMDFVNLTLEGYYCIQSFFLLVNLRAGKLLILDDEITYQNYKHQLLEQAKEQERHADIEMKEQEVEMQEVKEPQNAMDIDDKPNQQEEEKPQSWILKQVVSAGKKIEPEHLQVEAYVKPNEMIGISTLWKIAIDCLEKKVGEQVTSMLLQLHTQVEYDLQGQITEFEDQFIESCMKIINEQSAEILERSPDFNKAFNETLSQAYKGYYLSFKVRKNLPVQEKRIIACLSYLRMLILNSEKDGTLFLTTHQALDIGENLSNIQVNNSVFNFQTSQGYRAKFTVQAWSRETLYALKWRIANEISMWCNEKNVLVQAAPPHPYTLRVTKPGTSQILQDLDNGKTLEDLKFKNDETLTILKKPSQAVSKMPLLNEKGELTKRANRIFIEIFERYAIVDPDQPSRKVLSPQEVENYVKGATGATQVQGGVTQIMEYDSDKDGKMTLEDFLVFYKQSCKTKVQVVRDNLSFMGFRDDLTAMPAPGSDPNCLQIRKSYLQMPRFKISNNEQIFSSLIKLVDFQSEVSKEAQSLVKMCCTNQERFWDVLKLTNRDPNEHPFDWKMIFDPNNIQSTLYSLDIITSIMKQTPHGDGKETQLRTNWIQVFLQNGGFVQILWQLKYALDLSKEIHQSSQVDLTSEKETNVRNFIHQILRLAKIFVFAGIQASHKVEEASEVLLLRRNSSFKDQDSTSGQKDKSSGHPNIQIGQTDQDIPEDPEKPKDDDVQAAIAASLKENNETEVNAIDKNDDFEKSPRFKQIVDQIRDSGIALQLVADLDLKVLLQQLLEILSIFLCQDSSSSLSERKIITSALSLISAIVIQDNFLFDSFQTWTSGDSRIVSDAKSLILRGIYYPKSVEIRVRFRDNLELICEKVVGNKLTKPLIYLTNLLQANFPGSSDESLFSTKYPGEFFTLLGNLINSHSQMKTKLENLQESIDQKALFQASIDRLKAYQSTEKAGDVIEDSTLTGLILLNMEIFQSYPNQENYDEYIKFIESNQVIHELFYENLFYVPGKTLSPSMNKCKTKDSRTKAFKALYNLVKTFRPKEVAKFLSEYVWPMIQDMPRPSKWNHKSVESRMADTDFVGITNLGNICYMISMLQQFFMVPQFRNQLFKAIDESPEDMREYNGRMIDDNMLRQFQKLFAFLALSKRKAADPTDFCFAYKDLDGGPTKVGVQCDSQEFLNFFFDRMENVLKPTSQKYLVQDIFRGDSISQRKCLSCGYSVLGDPDHFYTLSVDVQNRQNLQESLQKQLEGEIISGFSCEGCNQKVDIQRRNLLCQMPNVLIVHLKRIVYDFVTWVLKKINSKFEFPMHLNFKKYSFKQNIDVPQEGKFDNEMLNMYMNQEDDEFEYRLVGVNIHRGTGTGGHYWSLIHTKRGNQEPDPYTDPSEWENGTSTSWQKFDDDTVTAYGPATIPADAFGGGTNSNMTEYEKDIYNSSQGDYGKSAYMLIYERKKKKNLREVVKNEDGEEQEVQIDYRKIDNQIPDIYSRTVEKDNVEFVVDRQVYNNQFFTLIKLMSKQVSSLALQPTMYDFSYRPNFHDMQTVAYQIGHKVLFDFLTHFNEGGSDGSQIVDFLSTILTFTENYVSFPKEGPSLIINTIENHLLADNCEYFFKVMFECPDRTARMNCGKFVSNLINKAFRIHGYCSEQPKSRESSKVLKLGELIDKFMTSCLTVMHHADCMKNWVRLEQFYIMLEDITKNSRYQAMYLLSRPTCIVTDICDLMLQDKSPKFMANKTVKRVEMGGSANNPYFKPLVGIVSHLITCMHPYEDTSNDSETFTKFKQEHNPELPCTLLDQKFVMSEECREFFTHESLMIPILNNDWKSEEYAKALAHLMQGNKRLSKQICAMTLRTITTSDYHKIGGYLNIVQQISMLQDFDRKTGKNLHTKRLEWVFGFPYMNTVYANQEKPKIGLDSLNQDIKGEVYVYKSMLTYDARNNDSLLHLLWRYQGRMDSFALVCLEKLISIITSKQENMEFFSNLPGVTYQFARYTDWIHPYLIKQVAKCDSYSVVSSENMTKLVSQFEVYLNYCENKDKEVKERLKNEYNFVQTDPSKIQELPQQSQVEEEEKKVEVEEIDKPTTDVEMQESAAVDSNKPEASAAHMSILTASPQPYVVCKMLEEIYLENFMEVEGVSLTMSHLKCSYVMSKPTGVTNQALGQKFIQEFMPRINLNPQRGYYQQIDGQGSQSKSAAAMLAERDQQIGYGGGSALRVKSQNSNSSPDSTNKQPSNIIVDQDDEWNNINKEGGYEPDQEDTSDPQNKDIPELITGTGEPKFEEDSKAKDKGTNGDDLFSNWDGDEIKECEDLIYKLTATNTTDQPLLVKISFEKVNESEETNLIVPQNGIKGKIMDGETTVVALLQKSVPIDSSIVSGFKTNELEKFKVVMSVKAEPSKQQISKASKAANQSVQFNDDVNMIDTSGYPDDFYESGGTAYGPQQQPQDSSAGNTLSEKNCADCTFLNPISATTCSICGCKVFL